MMQQEYKSSLIRATGIINKVISRKGGGAIFTWSSSEPDIPSVAQIPYNILPCLPERGEVWNIDGYIKDTSWGDQLIASDCSRGLPNGKLFIEYLARNPKFIAIDYGRAANLWNTYGESTYDVLTDYDVETICKDTKIPKQVIRDVCEVWNTYKKETEVIQWLHKHKLPARLAFKIVDYYDTEAVANLSENPYRLLAFLKWKVVDDLASRLNIENNDERRIVASVTSSLYEIWDKGSTAINNNKLTKMIKKKLGTSVNTEHVIKLSINKNEIIEIKDNIYQHLGANILEGYIKEYILNNQKTISLFKQFDKQRLHDFEKRKSHELGCEFTLLPEQIEAIKTVLSNSFACITGGAGVGKTTILEAVYDQINSPDSIIQCALSGRAQRRMTEATGYPAMTLAKLIHISEDNKLQEGSIIFIDESSMLDVPLFVRLIKSLPSNTELFLIGDAYQLPPIGPGLIFHLCIRSKNIPVAKLNHIHRAALKTGIPQASLAIRNQEIPQADNFVGLEEKDYGFSFIRTASYNEQTNAILRCYREMSEQGEVQVLAFSNKTCDIINGTLHNEHCEYQKSLGITPSVVGRTHERITEKEPIIWINTNDYSRELYNGSMGVLLEVYSIPTVNIDDKGNPIEYIARAEFDSCGPIELSEDDFYNVKKAYCVTGHKAQGSQWKRVIVSIEGSRNNDNSWLYTAITRSQKQVVCIGDINTFNRLATSTPTAFKRCVGLEL